MSIGTRINNSLAAIFNTENDDIYKALICNEDGNNPETITKPTDIDLGMMTSQVEYLRRLSIDLAKQLYIDEASGEFLTYTLVEFFDSLQQSGESETEWIQRTISEIFRPKVSRAMIIASTEQYSSQTPIRRDPQTISAYADYSWCDCSVYDADQACLPAITMPYDNHYYTFILVLYDVDIDLIETIKGLIRKIIGAGITCILLLEET